MKTNTTTHKKFAVSGMKCSGCECNIQDVLERLQGVASAKADFPSATVEVGFDPDLVTLAEIHTCIEQSGYSIDPQAKGRKSSKVNVFLSFLAVSGIVLAMVASRKLGHGFHLPDINSQLSDGMLFVVGLITGLHCVGMCGAFVLSYSAKDAEFGRSSFWSHILYGFGKTFSYAMFGAGFGMLGSVFSITPFLRGLTALIAGLFLLVFGLNMLNIFPSLRRIRLKQPESLARFAIEKRRQSRSPLLIGFFSGFILGCGPLQTMYVLAMGTGDPLQGAKILFLFGLGTLPALLSFGWLVHRLSESMTRRFLHASGLILIFLGCMMVNKGLIATGSGYDFHSVEQQIMQLLELQRDIR
ncbi:MAG: urease accessory protein UreH domain-containing protein [Gammaproteobacteria bacterium]